MKQLSILLLLVSVISIGNPLCANNPIYNQRRTAYIDSALAHFSPDAITLQALRGLPVDTASLHSLLATITTKDVVDFDIVKLVRVLFLSNGAYDTVILPRIYQVPYWLTKGEVLRVYWSENHLCMWMSSDWLLHERYGKPIDATLDYRLRHYLNLKIQYGFYEFYSSVYAPYCLSGLLNLADFAQDTMIKNTASKAAVRLLKDMMMLTNDKGVFYPIAGRNYFGKYETPYNQNHNNLIYLLTGMGQPPLGTSHAGGFLASSTIEVDSIINSWTPHIDTVYHVGHTIDSGFVFNSGLSTLDKVLFQWSSGAYFHPQVALQTAQLLTDSALWGHPDFAAFHLFSGFPVSSIPGFATQFSCASKSSVICGQDLVLFKNNSITLASVRDFWKGKLGFQQFPCVANIGTTAVFTASGPVSASWGNRAEPSENDHLPYVAQHKNVALLMYRPEPKPSLLGFVNPEVALHWTSADFDEVHSDSMWLVGRQGSSYAAARRYCLDSINTVPACYYTTDGQAYIIIVGDSTMYGNFNNFQTLIHQSQFTERRYIDTAAGKSIYYAKIVFDTTTIDYAWAIDTISATGIVSLQDNAGLKVYPNPVKDELTIDLSDFSYQDLLIQVIDIYGHAIYSEQLNNNKSTEKAIATKQWDVGMYIITMETTSGHFYKKIIKE